MGQSVGVARHRIEEIDTPEKLERLVEAYKAQWKCVNVKIGKVDGQGFVSIYEVAE